MATAEQYANWIVNNKDKKGTPEFDTVVRAYQASKQPAKQAQPSQDVEDYSVGEAPFMAQVGRGMMDVYQGTKQLGMNLFGDDESAEKYNKELKQELDLYEKNNPGFQAGRLAGNIATPLSLIPVGKAATTGGKVLQGMALGAGIGAAQPVQADDFWQEKAKQTAIGAGTGGALPVLVKGGKGAVNYLDELTKPMYKGGIARDVKKFVVEQAGDQRQKIVDALQKAEKKTVGQAIAKSRQGGDEYGSQFIKLEQELAREPLEGAPLRSIYGQQASERQKIIDAIAGTGEEMTRAKTLRRASTKPLYEAVSRSKSDVDVSPVTSKIDDVIAKNKNEDDITAPLKIIRDKLDDTSPQALYSLSKSIKKMMGKTTTGGQKEYNVGVLNDIKKTLDEQIGKSSHAFNVAQRSYANLSEPINRMQIGKELQGALTTALEKESPSTFTTAVSKAPRTLKRATGFPRFKELGDALKPQDVSDIQRISDELINVDKARRMGSSVGSVVKDLPGEVSLSLPHILSRPVVVANHILGMIGKDQTPEYKRLLVKMLLDSKELEKALALPIDNPKRKMVMDIMNKLSTIGASSTAAREGGEQ